MSNLVESDCSLSYGIVQPGKDFEGGLPVVRPTDLVQKIVGLDGLKRIDPELSKSYSRTLLRGGDLLLCVRGSTGTVSIAAPSLCGANTTRGIVPIRFSSELVDQDFGYYCLASEPVQNQIKSYTYGAALMQINIRDLKKIDIDFPSIKAQKELAKKMGSFSIKVERLESIYQQKLTALTELKQSILQKAFRGELTAGDSYGQW